MVVSALYIYPVKSCRGIAVHSASIDTLGFEGDRRFLVTDENGKFLTQRVIPEMALIETALDSINLELRAPGLTPLRVARTATGAPLKTVEVWSSQGLQAEDCGTEASEWLSSFLKQRVHLVRIGKEFNRPVKPTKAKPGDVVAFSDAYPFLVVSESSLQDLNDRMAERQEPPIPMDRFRPNIVVRGCGPYAEDTWTTFRVGNVQFRAAGDCVRCIVTTTDQTTAQRGKEPLRTLASYRRSATDPTGVIFGQNAIHEHKSGVVRVGDAVSVL